MSKWLEQVNQMQKELIELEAWIESVDWSELPQGVRMAIVRGQAKTEETIEICKKYAEKDYAKAE